MKRYIILLLMLFTALISVPFAQTDTEAVESNRIVGAISDDSPFLSIPLLITEENQLVEATMTTRSGDLDTMLYLVDMDGNIIAENDDGEGVGTNSALFFPNIPTGNYNLIATRYNEVNGSSEGQFNLEYAVRPVPNPLVEYDVSDEALTAAGFPDIEPKTQAKWTIIAYYGADTDLEPGLLNDFNEFELAGGSTDDVRIIMLIDRSDRYTDVDGNWDNARLYEIGDDISADEATNYPPTPDSAPLAELDELDTGSGETLALYLTWALRTYPADHYTIAFGSHGAGWQGLITDEKKFASDTSGSDTILSLPELQSAFRAAKGTTNIEKFDVLINDACLMSSVEYHVVMSEFFNISYASPEVVIDPALNMTDFARALQQNADTDLEMIGIELVDRYVEFDAVETGGSLAAYLTHAVTDLQQFDPVTVAINDFAELVLSEPQIYTNVIGQARANVHSYNSFFDRDKLIDVGDLMFAIVEEGTNKDLSMVAQGVIDALETATIHRDGGKLVSENASYYNIYFPSKSSDFDPQYFIDSPIAIWGTMLRAYYNVLTPKQWSFERTAATGIASVQGAAVLHPPVVPQVRLSSVFPEVGSAQSPFHIQAEVVGRNFDSATYVVDQVQPDGTLIRYTEQTILVAEFNEDGTIAELLNDWNAGVDLVTLIDDTKLPVISDGENIFNEFVNIQEEIASVNGRYREPNDEEWNDVTVIFDFGIEDSLAGEIGIVSQVLGQADNSDAVAAIRIPENSEFQTYTYIVTGDGRTVRQFGNSYNWGAEGVTVTSEPAPSGEYQIGVQMTTYSGITGSDTIRVRIDNDSIDNLQRFSDVDAGIVLAYPADWSEMRYIEEANYYTSANSDNSQEIIIASIPTTSTNLDAITQAFMGSPFGGDLITQPTTYTVNDIPVQTYAYKGEINQRERFVVAYTLANSATETAFVVAILGDTGGSELANIASDIMVSTEILGGNTREWNLEFIADESDVVLPVQQGWQSQTIDPVGAFYFPPDDEGDNFIGIFNDVSTDFRGDLTELANIMNATMIDQLKSLRPDHVVDRIETYHGKFATWQVIIYTATNDTGKAVQGRLYTSPIQTARATEAITVWAESPIDNPAIFQETFEVMIDGLRLRPLD